MEVRLEAVAWLARALGQAGPGRLEREVSLPDGATIADLLRGLVGEHPALADYALGPDGSLACPHLAVTVGGEVVAVPAELDRALRAGDVVVLLPAFAGGW